MNTPMAPKPLTRTLQMTMAGSSDSHDIIIRIGLPETDPDPGGDFRVLVEIDGFDKPYSRHFHGVDELQALLEGCSMVPHILTMLAPAGATLKWLGGDDLGFGTRNTTA